MLARTYRVVLRQTRDFEFHVVAEDSDDADESIAEYVADLLQQLYTLDGYTRKHIDEQWDELTDG